jgi:hypothetical protein
MRFSKTVLTIDAEKEITRVPEFIHDATFVMGLKHDQIKRIFRDFRAKERASWHLRQLPLTV